MIRVAINGFGRIGRNIFRAIYHRDDITVAAINDIADPKAMAYLLRFDSLRGPFPEPVRVVNGALYAKGQRIPILNGRKPGDTPWYDHGIDVVVEATGRYRLRAELQRHLDAGADRVILTTPPRDEVDTIHVCGVSPRPIARDHRIISCGSSTANCAALMVKVLDDAFGVSSGFFTSIHAYTREQSLIDMPSAHDLRLSRAAVENLVPAETWAALAIEQLFPKLAGRFGGFKLNVPVPDVSCIDLVTLHPREMRAEEVKAAFYSASESSLAGVLDCTDEPIVSSDVAGAKESCVFDSLSTLVCQGNMVKTIGWYDQGGGLAHRVVDTIAELGAPRVR